MIGSRNGVVIGTGSHLGFLPGHVDSLLISQ
jgi:hypothetical protein